MAPPPRDNDPLAPAREREPQVPFVPHKLAPDQWLLLQTCSTSKRFEQISRKHLAQREAEGMDENNVPITSHHALDGAACSTLTKLCRPAPPLAASE